MQVCRLLTVPPDIVENLLNLRTTLNFLLLMRNHCSQQVRNHVIQVLSEIVLCVNNTVDGKIACAITVLHVHVTDLSVQGMPELTHVATDKKSTA